MRKLLVRRLLHFFPTLFGVTALVFFLMRAAPGDGAYLRLRELGLDPSAEAVAAIREQLGLNRPLAAQYLAWLKDVFRLNLGTSLTTGEPVRTALARHFRWTLRLTAPVIPAILLAAFPLALASALNRRFDRAARAVLLVVMSVPSFCLGLLLIFLFSVRLRWLPSFGAGTKAHLALPVLTLSAGAAAYYARFIRAVLLEEFSKEYVRAARARGVRQRDILRAVLKNALIPITTSFGMSFATLLGGSAVVEKVFSWPGVGKYFIDAVLRRDYPVVQGCALLFAVVFVSANLTADIACLFLDPRARLRERSRTRA
ncbi:MAG: ABC transporter permease [Spirochaetaceae bacterium]|jgi:ABC-type dipeptide/oligopeptide/nickel transport system permease component|nr:ABC transporter permease [Spirochaetaceae bacterium]